MPSTIADNSGPSIIELSHPGPAHCSAADTALLASSSPTPQRTDAPRPGRPSVRQRRREWIVLRAAESGPPCFCLYPGGERLTRSRGKLSARFRIHERMLLDAVEQ